jgi:hypothetical protein
MTAAADELSRDLARIARLRRCPACDAVLAPEDLACARCDAVPVCPPHADWPPRLKWLVAALLVHRALHPARSEAEVWRVLLTDAVAPPQAHASRYARCRSADDAYPIALRLLAEWSAAGCPIDRAPLTALWHAARPLVGAPPAPSPSA